MNQFSKSADLKGKHLMHILDFAQLPVLQKKQKLLLIIVQTADSRVPA